jgi:small-conductance mechanosensitive channel
MTNILFSVIIYIYIIFFIISISKYKNITLSNTINNHYTEDFEKIFSELTVSFTYSNNMLGKNKPKLSIDINPSTGNEGLDAEKE